MNLNIPLEVLSQFVLAALIGMLIGLERGMKATKQPHAGMRDFVLFSLTGAMCALLADQYQSAWIIAVGLAGVSVFLLSGYWAELRDPAGDGERGITTELAAILTFLLGVSAFALNMELTIALGVIVLVVLSQKNTIGQFQMNVQRFELDAALKLLVITFIVLPFLPRVSLDNYLTLPLGTVESVSAENGTVVITTEDEGILVAGSIVPIYVSRDLPPGQIKVDASGPDALTASFSDIDAQLIAPGTQVHYALPIEWLRVMASAVTPFRLWVVVILVSLISFVGYVLVKVLGNSAGIGLTGLVGGLASSTVTALSFARRSKEAPGLSRQFAIAVILASTIMFPRLLLQIAVVNQTLMQRIAVPLLVMTFTGFVIAALYFFYSRKVDVNAGRLKLENPFSLASAVKFAMVFASVLIMTQLAISYLGNAWLPVVSVVSGLTDADAIAFSLSAAQRSGQISADWAAFNLVLGAISNTFTKLLLIFVLGDRALFRQVLLAFTVLSVVGLLTALIYYDISDVFI